VGNRGLVAVVILVVFVALSAGIEIATMDEVTITVEDKYMYAETRVSSDDEGTTSSITRHFIIVSTDGVTYRIGYPIWMPFKSKQTLYGRLTIGQTYKVRTVGMRIDWLSHYPRIYVITWSE